MHYDAISHHSPIIPIFMPSLSQGSLRVHSPSPEVLASSRALRRFVTGGVSGRPAPPWAAEVDEDEHVMKSLPWHWDTLW